MIRVIIPTPVASSERKAKVAVSMTHSSPVVTLGFSEEMPVG